MLLIKHELAIKPHNVDVLIKMYLLDMIGYEGLIAAQLCWLC